MSEYFPDPTPENMEFLRKAFVEARRKHQRRQTGIYDKFIVARTDGRDAPGEKHDGCRYFVLDLDHDKHAIPAIRAYAESCAVEYPALSADLSRLVNDAPSKGTDA